MQSDRITITLEKQISRTVVREAANTSKNLQLKSIIFSPSKFSNGFFIRSAIFRNKCLTSNSKNFIDKILSTLLIVTNSWWMVEMISNEENFEIYMYFGKWTVPKS